MDDQQIHAVSRIRYLAHECLRDQIGSSIVEVTSPEIEVGRKVRGKERVRRKGTGKRRRKDDLEQFEPAGEDVLPPLGIPRMELHHTPIVTVEDENDHPQPCLLPATLADDSQICYIPSKVDDTQMSDAANEVDGSHFDDAAEEVDDNLLSHPVDEKVLQPSHEAVVVVTQSSLVADDVAPQNDYSVMV